MIGIIIIARAAIMQNIENQMVLDNANAGMGIMRMKIVSYAIMHGNF